MTANTPAPTTQETGAPNLRTSEGGRAYVAEYFAKQIGRHDFARYITNTLAADFACALAQHLSKLRAPVADERAANGPRLRACPFCGGTPKEHDRFNSNVVTCRSCGAKVKQSAMGQGDAAERWNRRAALASAPVAGEAQEPVGEVFRHGEGRDENGPRVGIRMLPGAAGLPHGTRVYAAPQASECECARKSKAVADSEAEL